jgi:DNA-directed RNA polymerase subunit RPC12/RpoP
MVDSAAYFSDIFGPYMGIILGVLALAAVLLLNQVIFRQRWQSYPTRAQYLAAHPDCDKADGITCDRCGTTAVHLGVRGKGALYRCSWCETELFRVDRDERDQWR